MTGYRIEKFEKRLEPEVRSSLFLFNLNPGVVEIFH
jgi:hypothetical protein